MKKITKFLIIFLIFSAVLTQILKVYISNTAALDSIEASGLNAKIKEIEESNMELRTQILSLSSFQTIASRAADLGYRDSRDIISVYDPVKVAVSR
jgi:cell division protein FtsL